MFTRWLAGPATSSRWCAAEWGIDDPADQEWLGSLFGFHPLKSLADPIYLSGRHMSIERKVFILAARYDPNPFQQFAARTREQPGWSNYAEFPLHYGPVAKRGSGVAFALRRLNSFRNGRPRHRQLVSG
jgi:hypothetical protein